MNYKFYNGTCDTNTATGKPAKVCQAHNAINNREYYSLRILSASGWKTIVTRGTLTKITQVLAQN